MAERLARQRVFIEDSRANGLFLRTTWHPEADQFVISTWDDTACTGAVRVPAAQAGALIGLLADGLSDAASRRTSQSAENVQPKRTLRDRASKWAKQWLARDSKPVVSPDEAEIIPLWRDDLQ